MCDRNVISIIYAATCPGMEINMGIMGLFGKNKKTTESEKTTETTVNFYLGIEDTFRLTNSTDLVAVGHVHGTVTKGAAVYIANPGEDDAPISLTTIEGIEINGKPVESATDTNVGLKISRGADLQIKIGSVAFTRDISSKDVHDAYIQALGQAYISFRQMKLKEDDYAKMSLTDLAELRRLYCRFIERKKDQETEELRAFNQTVLDTISQHMCERVLSVKEIYTVIHKKTGEPFMISRVLKQPEGYLTTPPDIMLITKAYLEVMKKKYDPNLFDIVKIENGEDGKGIYNFLGSAFYLNGACGIKVIFDEFAIDASKLVPEPDYSNIPKIQIPVTNPDVERWLLLMGQMAPIGPENGEDEKTIYMIFNGHLMNALKNARFLIPMKLDGEVDPPDENGNTVIKKDSKISLATMPGKNDRDSILMYTDWKRLRMAYNEADGWSGMIQSIGEMIDMYDCTINYTEFVVAGCYISKNTYENDINK